MLNLGNLDQFVWDMRNKIDDYFRNNSGTIENDETDFGSEYKGQSPRKKDKASTEAAEIIECKYPGNKICEQINKIKTQQDCQLQQYRR